MRVIEISQFGPPDVLKLADTVKADATKALAAAQSDQEKLNSRSLLVRTTLLAADVARREQKDPKKTLELLADFEKQAEGLPNQSDLMGSVLFARVQSYMALGQNNEATQTLVSLLKAMPGGEGATIVYNLLEKLNADLDKARAAGDVEQMRVLANNRAQLSGFLIDWAKNNADENIRKYTYRYSVFDAATKALAADLEPDPAARKAGLQKALELYQKLQSDENLQLYRATLPKDASAADQSADPSVQLGIGLIAYDLADYAEAQKRLGQLLIDRKLGTRTQEIIENGEELTRFHVVAFLDEDAADFTADLRDDFGVGLGVESGSAAVHREHLAANRHGHFDWNGGVGLGVLFLGGLVTGNAIVGAGRDRQSEPGDGDAQESCFHDLPLCLRL